MAVSCKKTIPIVHQFAVTNSEFCFEKQKKIVNFFRLNILSELKLTIYLSLLLF